MSDEEDYIYGIFYSHPGLPDGKRLFKIGSTRKIEERKFAYVTACVFPVIYAFYFALDLKSLDREKYKDLKDCYQVDGKLRTEWLVDKHYYIGGGQEFYAFESTDNPIEILSSIFRNHGIPFVLYTKDIFTKRPKKMPKEEYVIPEDEERLETAFPKERYGNINISTKEKIVLRDYQKACWKKIKEWESSKAQRGKVIMACGTGKTVIMAKLPSKFPRMVIIVPYILLASQMTRYFSGDILIVDSEKTAGATTDPKKIASFIKCKEKYIIISTYSSSTLLDKIPLDLIVFDEAHRTVGDSTKFSSCLMKKEKTRMLFFTATEKIVESKKETEDDIILSMDDPKAYGKEIYRYPLSQAISEGWLSDYDVRFEVGDKIKSLIKLLKTHIFNHPIIFCNTIKIARKVSDDLISAGFPSAAIIEESDMASRKDIFEKFNSNPVFVLTTCRVLSVGIDLPICDAVILYQNKKSHIDIIQTLGRCLRLYPGKYRSRFIVMLGEINEETEDIRFISPIRLYLKNIFQNDTRFYSQTEKYHNLAPKYRESGGIVIESDDYKDLNFSIIEKIREYIYDRFMNVGSWDKSYSRVSEYYEKIGGFPPQSTKDGRWVSRQKQALQGRGSDKLSQEQLEKLLLIPPLKLLYESFLKGDKDCRQTVWKNSFLELKIYFEENDNRYPPFKSKLGKWISCQKRTIMGEEKYPMKPKRLVRLLTLKPIKIWYEIIQDGWKPKEVPWRISCLEVIKYINDPRNGEKLPPRRTKIGDWVGTQKACLKRTNDRALNEKQALELLKIKPMLEWAVKNKSSILPQYRDLIPE